MLAKTGLVIISNPRQISRCLRRAQQQVNNMLYVHLTSGILEPLGRMKLPPPTFSQTVKSIYSQAANDCGNLDVRVLLSGLKYDLPRITTQSAIDLVIFDREYGTMEVERFLRECVSNASGNCSYVTLPANDTAMECPFGIPLSDVRSYEHTVLGGTFDRLHLAHKVLLSEAILRATQKVTIGITEENMLENKTLWELIQPIEERIGNVESFVIDVCGEQLQYDVVPISDPMGPTKSDGTMDMLVVSAETTKGGDKVNEIRSRNGLPPINIVAVDLIDEPHPQANEEPKISSSTYRIRLLGSLLQPVKSNLPRKPYIIGLTGGIASGKTNVSDRMRELGAYVINCDHVGHKVYRHGTDCYQQVVTEFGADVVGDDGEINRSKLSSIVFGTKERLERLNTIVWPAIAQAVNEEIRSSNADTIVIEAAILMAAQWQHMCHEVWATVVSRHEAVRRIKARNALSEKEALQRINAQPSSKFYASNANVVICSMWDFHYTRYQIDKAWDLLQKRVFQSSLDC